MFSRTSLRKSSPSIRRVLLANQRLWTREFFNQSEGPTSSSSSLGSVNGSSNGGSNNGGEKLFESFVGSMSLRNIGIAGLSLGFCYWFNDNLEKRSLLCYADAPKEATLMTEDDFVEGLTNKKNPKFLFGDAYRRRVFFNYEKRLRMQSPPEKVFEYFASHRTPAGEVLMTPSDLMRAIVHVFPPSESNRVREGYLRGERVHGELHCPPSKFFMLFDTNNDGLISYPEYIFFLTLLSIPESSFLVAFKMFDLDNNGEIDREEFKKVMSLMRAQSKQEARHRDGRRARLKVMESAENGGLVEYFFGKEGKTCLKHERFAQFLRDLHDEILRLEFAHYDYRVRGTISAKDFALSLVASADITHLNKLLDRVDELNNEPNLRNLQISFQEFKDFAELRKQLQSLSLAIFSFGKVNGSLTKKDFQRAASQVCGISITDNVVDIIFHLFDTNQDGNLSSSEFVRVLQRRERDFSQHHEESGFRGLISCWLKCSAKCSSAKPLF